MIAGSTISASVCAIGSVLRTRGGLFGIGIDARLFVYESNWLHE